MKPVVSVVMPVHNGERYLPEALESLARQTLTDFELIAIDDSSTDRTREIIDEFEDPRFRCISNSTQQGVAKSLMRGIDMARGKYIARMDADDICLHSRFSAQVGFLERHAGVSVLGSNALLIGATRKPFNIQYRRDDAIRVALLFRSALIHPSVMFRPSAIPEWYDVDRRGAEDYDLWVRLAIAGVRFANLSRPLIRYRIHAQQVTASNGIARVADGDRGRRAWLVHVLGAADPSDLVLLGQLSSRSLRPESVLALVDLRERLLHANRLTATFSEGALSKLTAFELLLGVARLDGGVAALDSAARASVRRIQRQEPGVSAMARANAIGWRTMARASGART